MSTGKILIAIYLFSWKKNNNVNGHVLNGDLHLFTSWENEGKGLVRFSWDSFGNFCLVFYEVLSWKQIQRKSSQKQNGHIYDVTFKLAVF